MVSTTALPIGTIDPAAGLCDTTDHLAPFPPKCSVYSLAFSPAASIRTTAGWLDLLARPIIPTALGTTGLTCEPMGALPDTEGIFGEATRIVGATDRSVVVVTA